MASLVEIRGNYYLQFYDGNKSPSRKKVSLGTNRKRVAQKLNRKYEDAYALGEYDPWTGKKLDEPDRYLDVSEALKLFLEEKRQAGLAESSIGSCEDEVRVTSKDKALGELSELRSQGGTGNSKYHPAFEKCKAEIETEDDALVIESIGGEPISDTQVSGLRDYLNRRRPDKYVVRSHRMDTEGEEYKVVVFLDTSEEE